MTTVRRSGAGQVATALLILLLVGALVVVAGGLALAASSHPTDNSEDFSELGRAIGYGVAFLGGLLAIFAAAILGIRRQSWLRRNESGSALPLPASISWALTASSVAATVVAVLGLSLFLGLGNSSGAAQELGLFIAVACGAAVWYFAAKIRRERELRDR